MNVDLTYSVLVDNTAKEVSNSPTIKYSNIEKARSLNVLTNIVADYKDDSKSNDGNANIDIDTDSDNNNVSQSNEKEQFIHQKTIKIPDTASTVSIVVISLGLCMILIGVVFLKDYSK